MAHQYVFQMHRLSRSYPPDKEVLKNVTLAFLPGAKIGVLGYNGAGKSTVLRIMAGEDKEYRGDAMLAPDATVGLLEQEPKLDESKDVRGNVEDGVREVKDMLDRFNELSMNYSEETADEFAALQERIDAVDAWTLDSRLDQAMDALRLPPADADVSRLSGGERRRVALCRLLLRAPDLLLLDEPTNHLDAESVAWLERHLEEYAGTVVAVTHDRYFLDNVTGWILELDRGHGLPYEGNYSSWLEQKQKRLAHEERSEKARQRTISAELDWVRQNPKGRQTKQKARLRNYEALVAEERNVKLDQVQIHIPAGPRLGEIVVEAEGLRKGFGDRLLIEDLSFSLPRGGIVGVIGANGAGKTTLFRMITGEEQPDGGTLKIGETVELAYVDQSRDALDPDKTVWQEISGEHGHDPGRRPDDELTRVLQRVQLQGLRPAEGRRQALRRRAQPPAPGQAAAHRRQRPAPRRADQRPRRRHAARARGGAPGVPGLRGGHLPRSLVPGPHRDPRARVRGRLAGHVVRGQLRGLRGAPPRAARRRGRPPAPDHVQEAPARMSALVAIEHFTDPTCPWAFSAEPQRWRLRWLYGDQLAWTDRMVVLSEDAAEVEAVFPPEIHAKAMAMIQQRFGMPIDTGERPRSAASAPACAAVVATRLNASPEQAESLLRALRVRIMGGELPDDPATVAGAAQDAGLDAEQVKAWTESGDAAAALAADRSAARDPLPAARLLDHKLGGPAEERRYTCPSYIAITEATGATTAPGYQPIESYEVMLANVAPGLHRRDEPTGVAEVLAWAGTPLATAEVALLCGMDHDEAREALVEAGAVERPVGADAYWSL